MSQRRTTKSAMLRSPLTSVEPIDGSLDGDIKRVEVVACYVERLQQCDAHRELERKTDRQKIQRAKLERKTDIQKIQQAKLERKTERQKNQHTKLERKTETEKSAH